MSVYVGAVGVFQITDSTDKTPTFIIERRDSQFFDDFQHLCELELANCGCRYDPVSPKAYFAYVLCDFISMSVVVGVLSVLSVLRSETIY